MAATAEAEVVKITEVATAAEWAAMLEAEAVKIAAGEAVSRRKVARVPNPAISRLPRLLLLSRIPQSLGMLKLFRLCNGAGHSQHPTWRIFG